MSSISIWFRGLRFKLLLCAAIAIIALCAVSTISYHSLNKYSHHLHRSYDQVTPTIDSINTMNTSQANILRFFWKTIGLEGNIPERIISIKKIREAVAVYKSNEEIYNPLPQFEAETPIDKNVKASESEMFKGIDEILVLLEKHTPETDGQAKSLLSGKYLPHFVTVEKGLGEIAEMYSKYAKDQVTVIDKETNTIQLLLAGVSIISILCLVSIIIFIASRLAGTLTEVTRSIADSGTQVGSSSQQLSSASQQLSSGATEAASSLEETVSSLEELSSMVKLNADNAKEASSLSQTSRKSAEDGESEIKNLISAMKDISKSSKKIEEIINVIDDIAFQTNLLALNAAVEAARAGEQGKGFAVVAEAVRNLAHRSASAAKDITILIKDSVQQISHGTKIADQSGEVLKNIVSAVKRVSDLNNEIASASAEQSSGISQISKAMNELDQATQRNAASAEETAASSEEMSAQAVELQNLVARLGSVIEGQSQPTDIGAPRKERYNVIQMKRTAHSKSGGYKDKII